MSNAQDLHNCLQVLILVGANVQNAGEITPKEGDFDSTYRTTQPSIVLRWGIQVRSNTYRRSLVQGMAEWVSRLHCALMWIIVLRNPCSSEMPCLHKTGIILYNMLHGSHCS